MNQAEFHSSRQFVATPYGRVAYVERGSGRPALFLHGLPLCGYQWRDVLEDLTDDLADGQCRGLAPDLLGLGYSEVPAAQDVSFKAQAAMLAALLDALAIDRVDLCGNDTGGGIAQIFTALYPARVRSLTLTNCEVHDRWPNAMLQGFYAGVAAGAFADGLQAMLGDIAVARQQLGAAFEYPDRLTPELAALYFQPLVASPTRREHLRGFSQWATNRDQLVASAPALKAARVPAQVIWGAADTVFDRLPSLKWLRNNLGDLRRTIDVPRAKLFFPEEHPRLLSVLLKEFWGSLD